jgi:hypothetical protein
VTLGERIAAAARAASIEALASADFLRGAELVKAPIGGPNEADECAGAMLRALAGKNQFVAADPVVATEVRRALMSIWSTPDRAMALACAREDIAAVLSRALGPTPREVVAGEYGAELQIAVLGIDPAALAEPILDIGCGEAATLVRHLRGLRKDARGLDPFAPLDVGERGDWLTYDYGTSRWGTLVSHMAFTLHFIHQEMRRSNLAFDYAKAYMRMVRSLLPGGTFAYVPGVPFVETFLPKDEFVVKQVPLPADRLSLQVMQVQRDTGLVLDAATHVTRRE